MSFFSHLQHSNIILNPSQKHGFYNDHFKLVKMGAGSSLNEAVVTNRGRILEFGTVLVITDLGSGCYRSRQLKSGQSY